MSNPLCYTRRMKNMKNETKRYVVELGGVSHDERGYLRGEQRTNGSRVYEWVPLFECTCFASAKAAIECFKESGLFGGVLIETGMGFANWKTVKTI